jgi:hypothetical protein
LNESSLERPFKRNLTLHRWLPIKSKLLLLSLNEQCMSRRRIDR